MLNGLLEREHADRKSEIEALKIEIASAETSSAALTKSRLELQKQVDQLTRDLKVGSAELQTVRDDSGRMKEQRITSQDEVARLTGLRTRTQVEVDALTGQRASLQKAVTDLQLSYDKSVTESALNSKMVALTNALTEAIERVISALKKSPPPSVAPAAPSDGSRE